MYKSKQVRRAVELSAVIFGFIVGGSAHGIQYYNLTQIEAKTQDDYVVTAGSYDTAIINGAIFTTTIPQQVVGTGVIDPFLRVQATRDNLLGIQQGANCNNNTGEGCVEAGYNTDGNGTKGQYQTKDREGSNWNRTININDIGKICENGKCYYTFILDINERVGGSKHDEFLSLDQFRIFASNNANLEGYDFGGSATTSSPDGNPAYDPTKHTLGLEKAVFDMDFNQSNCTGNDANPADLQTFGQSGNPTNPLGAYGGASGTAVCDRTVGLNYGLNHGSGLGVDLVVKVPEEVFIGKGPYIYLFSSFGELAINADTGSNASKPAGNLPAGDFSQSAGFEEWATLKKTPISPTLALLMIGLVALGGVRKLRPALRFA